MTAPSRHSSGRRIVAVRPQVQAAVLFLTSSLMVLAGCNDGASDASPPEPSRVRTSSPSPSSGSADADVYAAVIAAYTSSWDAKTEAYRKASSAGTDMRKYTTLEALADAERSLSAMKSAGQVTTGRPVIHPKVVNVTNAEIPKATVTDCVDTTSWTLIDKATKKKVPLPSERLIKYVSTALLEKWGTKWMVTELTAQDQAC